MSDITPPEVPFLNEWGTKPTEKTRRAYVQLEVERLMEAGEPVLHHAMMLPFFEQLNMAIETLIAASYQPRLRLHANAKPPLKDANGKDVPPHFAGKVLIGKTGTLGAKENASPDEMEAWNATARIRRANIGKPLYAQKTITRDRAGVVCSVEEAVILMKMWGIGCRNPRFSKVDEKIARDNDGNVVKTPVLRDHWCLEEVTDAMLERERVESKPEAKPAKKDASQQSAGA